MFERHGAEAWKFKNKKCSVLRDGKGDYAPLLMRKVVGAGGGQNAKKR